MNTHSTTQPPLIRSRKFPWSAVRFLCLALAVMTAMINPRTATAANIVWVTDANDPATGFFPPESDFTDSGFVTLLQNAGHNVIRYNPPGAATSLTSDELTAFNTNDLVIISRCVNSGIFQAPQSLQVTQWNTAITKPLMDLSAFHARNSRLGWFAANEGGDNTPTPLSAVFTGETARDAVIDYLFSGVAMNGTNSVLPFDNTADRNSTPIPSAPVAGGIIYATGTYAREDSANPATPTITTGNFIVGYPANTAVRAGADILGGYRMFFAAGSRESATAPNVIQFYTSRENLTPTGEGIFLRAVQVALNSGAAPATDPGAPILFTTQPVSATVLQGRPTTFSASVSGAFPRTLEWQRDTGDGVTFTNIPDAGTPFSASELALPAVSAEDHNAKFRLVATNPNGTVTSEVVTLTVTPDEAPPVPLTAGSLDGNTINVFFDEALDSTTAASPFGYTLVTESGAQVSEASLRPDGRSVLLTLDGPASATFTLTIKDVADRFSHAIPEPGVTLAGVNHGLTAVDVNTLNPVGEHAAIDASTFRLSGGGLDMASTADFLRFAYKTVEGDFDARVHVSSLVGVPDHLETTAKAVLTAREGTDAGSAAVNVLITPLPPGDNTIFSNYRPTTGAATNVLGAPFIPGLSGNEWMRIKRAGNVFTTYRSANGTDWIEFGSTTLSLAASLRVGAGVVSHRNGRLATGTFNDFSITQSAARPTITGLSYTAGSFSGSFQSQNGVSYVVQFKDDLNAPMWQTLTTIPGDGTVKSFIDPGPAGAQRFYQVVIP